MSENTKIEWADHTFNPWEGCTKVGPGCDHCYAEARNSRFNGGHSINWGPGAPRRPTSSDNWDKPRKWNARHTAFFAQHGRRQSVFCASLADWLDNAVPIEWLVDLLDLIRRTPDLDWLLLTKRIGNWRGRLEAARDFALQWRRDELHQWIDAWLNGDAPSNVRLGVTVVNQPEADRDIPKLLAVPARVRFLSIEPMLGPITLREVHSDVCEIDVLTGDHGILRPLRGRSDAKVHWVIAGGESGQKARPMHPDWARALRDQCAAAGVPFLFKQWGEHVLWSQHPDYDPKADGQDQTDPRATLKLGKKAAGRLLDGVEHNGFPA